MNWRLIEQDEARYFEFDRGEHSAVYTTKHGQDDFIKASNPAFLKQVHSKIIVNADSSDEHTGDGLFSTTNRCIGIKVADCLPVYIFTQGKICIIHCGWRGIVEGIAREAKKMLGDFQFIMGASIGPCCYEIQQDVADLFAGNYPGAVIERNGKYFLDLKAAVTHDLRNATLLGTLDLCTKCHPEFFYSHRRGDRLRNYAFISYNTYKD
jgi:YfiH family protein